MDFTIDILPAAPNFDFSVGVGISDFTIDVYAGGVKGDGAYVYIAYASDSSGTGFTSTFNPTLDYIAIKETDAFILSPIASDFSGLWKNYKGAQGIQGLHGEAATITVGTVATGAASTSVIVNNSGNQNDAVFNFTIPQGVQGSQGIQGEPAIPTVIITETPTGLINGSNADFTLSQTPVAASAIFFLVNGIRRDITLVGNVCTLDFAPTVGSIIRVTYFKYIDVLAVTVSDIIDLGTAAMADYNDFLPRVLSPVFTTSTSQIALNCLNQIQYDTNSGTTDVTIAFSNLPTVSIENLLIVNSLQATAFTITLPTDFVSGGVNYSIKKLTQDPYIEIGGSCELNFLFIFTDLTHCEIRITGGTNV